MVISFLLMLIASVSAAILPFNGQTTGNISDSYTILAFPAKYVFFVLFLVYLLILYWFYKQWQIVRKDIFKITFIQTLLFTLSMIFQIIWIYYWHQQQFITSCIIAIIAALLLAVFYFLMPTQNTFSTRIPISIYLAWLINLIIFNIAIIFVSNRYDDFLLSPPLWTVIFLTGATAVALHIRYHHHDPYFPILFVWINIGIAIENNFEELLVTTAAIFLSGVLVAGILFMRKRQVLYNK